MPASRYQRIRGSADDDDVRPSASPVRPIPNSPPPSFHSRASSLDQRRQQQPVDPALVDAFDADDSGDDEADDRQRLVQSNLLPASNPPLFSSGVSVAGSLGSVSVPSRGGRVYGGGIQSDGVFSNLSAKPTVGDEEKEDLPPSYEQAAADQAPPYWETFVMAPGLGGSDEVYLEGMPIGNLFGFVWNALISWSFQIVGFFLTYLLHSTHAAKHGSRAGAGLTLIQMGFSMQEMANYGPPSQTDNDQDGFTAAPPDPNSHSFDPSDVTGDSDYDVFSNADWFAYLLMIVGWLILIRGVSDYIAVRRYEQMILQSHDRGLGTAIIADGEPSERVV